MKMGYEYNTYPCPECEDDVEVALPCSKYATCTGCGAHLEVHPDADFDDGGWHDLTHLSVARPADGEDIEEWQYQSEKGGE